MIPREPANFCSGIREELFRVINFISRSKYVFLYKQNRTSYKLVSGD